MTRLQNTVSEERRFITDLEKGDELCESLFSIRREFVFYLLTKHRLLAQFGEVQLTIAHDDGEVSSATGCEAMVEFVDGAEGSASSLTGVTVKAKCMLLQWCRT